MTELDAIRAEQRHARDLLHAGHPEQRGLRCALNDWFDEEMLLLSSPSSETPACTSHEGEPGPADTLRESGGAA